MTQPESDETVYRFASFAARGAVTLRRDCVHTKTRTHLGWWEQTIPLSDLKPHYGTLTVTPQVFVWACIFAIALVCIGVYGLIWGLWAIPRKSISLLLLASGLSLGWHLVRHRKSEWIIFNAYDEGGRVGYTRQGPDAEKCDMFTERLASSIRSSRKGQNHDDARESPSSVS